MTMHLSDHPAHHNVGVLRVKEHVFGQAVNAEVSGRVDENTLYRDFEALLQVRMPLDLVTFTKQSPAQCPISSHQLPDRFS